MSFHGTAVENNPVGIHADRQLSGSTPSEKVTKPTEKFLVATPKLVENGSYSLETEDVEWKEGNGVALTETVIQANVPDLSHTTASLERALVVVLYLDMVDNTNAGYLPRLYSLRIRCTFRFFIHDSGDMLGPHQHALVRM